VLQKEDNDWVMKCMGDEVDGARPRGRPNETWREIVAKDCKARGLNREDTMDCIRWRKQMGIFDDHGGCEWVNASSGTGSPGFRGKSGPALAISMPADSANVLAIEKPDETVCKPRWHSCQLAFFQPIALSSRPTCI